MSYLDWPIPTGWSSQNIVARFVHGRARTVFRTPLVFRRQVRTRLESGEQDAEAFARRRGAADAHGRSPVIVDGRAAAGRRASPLSAAYPHGHGSDLHNTGHRRKPWMASTRLHRPA